MPGIYLAVFQPQLSVFPNSEGWRLQGLVVVGDVDDCEGWWWCDQWRTSQLTLPFLFVLSVGQPAGSPCRLDCLTCSSHLATYSITSPADRLLITHQSGLQARADCSCLIDTNWRVVTLCSFKNKCFYSVRLISNQHTSSSQPDQWLTPAQVQHEHQTEINLLFRIMRSEEGWWRWLHPVDSGHILSPISTCWSSDPPTAPIISPVTELCSLKISSNGCTRIK